MDFLEELWDNVISGYMWLGTFNSWQYFLFAAVVFTPLALLFPSTQKQSVVRKDSITDVIYWFIVPVVFYGPLRILLVSIIVALGIRSADDLNLIHTSGIGAVAELPIWVQTIIVFLLYDIIQYWTHRLFHTGKFWPFHAIHHSPTEIDWMTSSRFHPVNFFVHSICVGSMIYIIGFSPMVWVITNSFNVIYSPLVHANLNWTYGPFRYVLASPVFHRWHHTYEEEGGNKNFAPTFPVLDIIFGTYYDPKDKKPQIFGAPNDAIPNHIVGHMTYPFKSFFVKKAENDGKI